jgi:hypothetical protein
VYKDGLIIIIIIRMHDVISTNLTDLSEKDPPSLGTTGRSAHHT